MPSASARADDPNWQVAWDRFHGLCVVCLNPADTVHEIVPKSLAPKTWRDLENRVTLCREHHWEVHNKTGTRKAAPGLRERMAFVLSLYGS